MTSYYIPRQPKENPDMNEATRAWIYRILVAAVPVLIAYGVLDEATAAVWVAGAAAVLGIGLAVGNTSTKPG